MDTIATRELARIQAVLHVLRTQRDTLSELSDISAFRGLEESYREDLQEAKKRGLVPPDPVAAVQADWRRLVAWSNRIQRALRAADELGKQTDSAGSRSNQESGKKKKQSYTYLPQVGTGWAPTLTDLQHLKTALEEAPKALAETIEQGRDSLQEGDWSNGRPHPELAEIADAMEWAEKLELAESPGAWANGVGLRELPLVASRLAIERSGSLIERRLMRLKDRIERVVGLIQLHSQHAATLEEVGRLTSSGQVESARQMLATVPADFDDLDHAGSEYAVGLAETSIVKLENSCRDELRRILSLAQVVQQASFFRRGSARKALQAALPQMEQLKDQLTFVVAGKAGSDLAQRLAPCIELLEALKVGGIESDWGKLRTGVEKLEAKAVATSAEALFAAMLGIGHPFLPRARGNAGGVPVRWIPAGRYTMGSPEGEEGRDTDEVQHEVVLSRGFFLAETACTQEQWATVMGSNPSEFKGADRPVEQVTWEEAVEYCRKLTKRQRAERILPEGWEWRLPTEAEWEYAARAGTTGERYDKLDAVAWYGNEMDEEEEDIEGTGNSGDQTHPVKQKVPNAWGVYDMLGNVCEWCSDWYGEYPTLRLKDPTGPSSGSDRVSRGGSWLDHPGCVRSGHRCEWDPGSRSDDLGFRPALSSVR